MSPISNVHLDRVERGSGDPPILFLHGMACVRQDMDLLIDAFAPEHRCVAFDMRGHGASDIPVDAAAPGVIGKDGATEFAAAGARFAVDGNCCCAHCISSEVMSRVTAFC